VSSTDWRDWHAHYDDPESSLSRRLQAVREQVGDLLAAGGVRRVLSLCAGDGRDLVPVLARCAADERPETVLVELDPSLAEAAERRAAESGVAVRVVVGDAGAPQTWRDVPPVDLLILCGIFGNISDDDIRSTIRVAPTLLSPDGAVVWTRGAHGDRDLRPLIRRWFAEAGFEELAFVHEEAGYGVGVNRVTAAAQPLAVPERLFSFVR